MASPKQSAILYLYKDHHGILLESCFPRPPANSPIRRPLSIKANNSGYVYTWHPDGSCTCNMLNGMEIVWWAPPHPREFFVARPQGCYTRMHPDGSIETRDRWGRSYFWNRTETMTIHGEVLPNICDGCGRDHADRPYISVEEYELYGRGYDAYYECPYED